MAGSVRAPAGADSRAVPCAVPGTVTSCLARLGAAARNSRAAPADPYGSRVAVTSSSGQCRRRTECTTMMAGCRMDSADSDTTPRTV
jgi:hypothetical protein